MGLRTFESLNSKPLPGRENIVLSDQPLNLEGIVVVKTLEEAYRVANNDIFVIGGGITYKMALDDADYLYITEVHDFFPGSTVFFPEIDKDLWEEISRKDLLADDLNKHDYSFVIYKRRARG